MRQAISLLFDAEWINRNFFFDLYRRSASFFDDFELSAYRRPADATERALLAPFPDAVRADVLDGTWSLPATDGSGRDRESAAPGAGVCSTPPDTNSRARRCASAATGRPFTFEIMVTNRDDERLALAFSSNLARAGIDARVRLVDDVQYRSAAARRSIST